MLLRRYPDSLWLLILSFCSSVFGGSSIHVHHYPHTVSCSMLVVFGDGLSDDGAEISTEESHGFLRNSNGPVWPEYLKQLLGCDKYINYAYSGARSDLNNFYFENWSGIQWQIDQFLSRRGRSPSKDAIIVLQTGGLIDLFSGESNSSSIIANLKATLNELAASRSIGEATLVLMNLPDLSSAPGLRFAEDGAQIRENFGVSIAQINMQIRSIALDFSRLKDPKSNLNIRLFDLNTALFRATAPLNTTEPFSYQKPETKAKDLNRYAYHDLWHPTTAVHFEIAKDIVTFLEDA
uniref:SGNH_hydro domain-containing protein n=1 Tax=Panagrellus redivivus TaxID=6233 RepID=A0A7E4W305_PANRE